MSEYVESGKAMFTKVTTQYHREMIASLAREIWTEHYIPIIGKEQVEYMLDRFQSKEALAEQIKAGSSYFIIKEDDQPIGYMGIQFKDDELFLSKLYVKSVKRGRGFGKKAIHYCENIAKEKGLTKIVLTVNKNNLSSIKVYEAVGFKNLGSIIQEIGGGFIMDDYKMGKIL